MLFERLLLLIYAYGTGTGIRAVAAGDHPHTQDDLRHARRRYLTVEACREVGLNVVENYNGVNDYIKFGERGELASNRREEQEPGMLYLHILQSALGLINPLMIQDTLALPEWENVLTDADRRGLTPLFHTDMTRYAEIQLRTDRRLDLTDLATA
ncbi:Tn3 family transposase [Nonomuraea sp. JJY05]|uniref:Tn3 family transposase n=1 Tax=Nonomuraea sp. JJY05 TaxID=3350255 RepID=UPI00373DF36E